MNNRRLEVLLPADVSVHDYAAVANAIWVVLDSVGLDEGCSLLPDAEFIDQGDERAGEGG